MREAQRLLHPCFLQVERVDVQEHQVNVRYTSEQFRLGTINASWMSY